MTRGQTITAAIELSASPEVGGRLRDDLATLPPPLAGEDEIVRRLREQLRDSLETLQRIASGNVRRNDATALRGIELQLRYSQPLPKQVLEHQGSVGIAVIDPYATGDRELRVSDLDGRTEPEAVKAVAPTIRRKSEEQ